MVSLSSAPLTMHTKLCVAVHSTVHSWLDKMVLSTNSIEAAVDCTIVVGQAKSLVSVHTIVEGVVPATASLSFKPSKSICQHLVLSMLLYANFCTEAIWKSPFAYV